MTIMWPCMWPCDHHTCVGVEKMTYLWASDMFGNKISDFSPLLKEKNNRDQILKLNFKCYYQITVTDTLEAIWEYILLQKKQYTHRLHGQLPPDQRRVYHFHSYHPSLCAIMNWTITVVLSHQCMFSCLSFAQRCIDISCRNVLSSAVNPVHPIAPICAKSIY